jgi:hypothetical protein
MKISSPKAINWTLKQYGYNKRHFPNSVRTQKLLGLKMKKFCCWAGTNFFFKSNMPVYLNWTTAPIVGPAAGQLSLMPACMTSQPHSAVHVVMDRLLKISQYCRRRDSFLLTASLLRSTFCPTFTMH